ncbi:MAG: hypothetical protein KDA61_21655, partial [Planctomycetales bacterium]|nr:hypothetical protein [Planctomycetales bacterium]
MLVAMAITLLMMAAVVNLFANISTGVRDRRALIEMSGQLRVAQQQLTRDLQNATCTGTTWQRPEENKGYIEIVEGRWSDAEPGALLNDPDGDGRDVYGNNVGNDGELDYDASLVPGSQFAASEENPRDVNNNGINDATDGRGLGDYDDILALTVRSKGEPFVGRGPGGQRIESHEAEVIWFAVENPADGSLGEPGFRRVYRRVLLIAPWLASAFVDQTISPNNFNYANQIAANTNPGSGVSVDDFFREYDISCHVDAKTGLWTPNTLGDLTKRENRFAHQPNWDYSLPGYANAYPNQIDVSAIRLDPQNAANLYFNGYPTTSRSPLHPLGMPFETSVDSNTQEPLSIEGFIGLNAGTPVLLNRAGEDLVLDNALAFDIRVFDPDAPLIQINDAAGTPLTVLQPGDVGLRDPRSGNFILPANSAAQPIGYGAYVDLCWNVHPGVNSNSAVNFPNALPPRNWPVAANGKLSIFGGRPSQKSGLDLMGTTGWDGAILNAFRSAAYDTWSFHYEHDGLNTDGDDINGVPLIDEGTNQLDDVPYVDGVDDL